MEEGQDGYTSFVYPRPHSQYGQAAIIEPIATGLFKLAIGRALLGFRGDFKSASV